MSAVTGRTKTGAPQVFLKSFIGSSVLLGVFVSLTVCYLALERSPREFCEYVPGLKPADFMQVIQLCDIRPGALTGLFLTSLAVISGSLLGPVVLALGGTALLRYLLRRRGDMTRTIPQDRNLLSTSPAHPKPVPESHPERGWQMAKRFYFVLCGFALSAGLTWSVIAIYAALQHNPQGEFCSYSSFDGKGVSAWLGLDCDLQWLDLAFFPLACGIIGSVPLILYGIVAAIARVWQRLAGTVRA